MKIIKVVHAVTKEDLENQKQMFSLQTYDVKDITDRLAKELNTENKSRLAVDIASSLIPGIGVQRMVWKNLEARVAINAAGRAIIRDIQAHVEKVKVISLEAAKSTYTRSHNLSVGTYTLHPYDSQRLTRIENYHMDLAMEKDDELIILLGKMGAKTIKILEKSSYEKKGDFNLSGSSIVTDIDGKAEISQRIEAGKNLLVTFEGNTVDIDPNLLRTSLWFATDSRLHSIFESRRFNPNKIEQYTLRNTYTETFDFDFELAGRYLAVKVDLEAKYNALSQKEREFHVVFGKTEGALRM